MSEAQLKKLLAENQNLQGQLERTKTIIKTSQACQELTEFVQKQPDPFINGNNHENPWLTNPKGPMCLVV